MTASLNNKRPLFSLVAADPHSMFRSRGALISIAAAALVLASTGLISRPANQSSTELPIRNMLGSVQKVLVATVKGIARAALTPPPNACTARCGTYLSRDPWAPENQDANSRAPVPQL
jgi:hypothetical protein